MPIALMLPSMEDVANFDADRCPENILEFHFETMAEAEDFENGVNAVDDLASYDIVSETETTLTYYVAGEKGTSPFPNAACKEAFKKGMDASDGWRQPLVALEGSDDFDAIQALRAAATPEALAP